MSVYSNTCKHLHYACQAYPRHIIDQIPLLKEANSNDIIGDSDTANDNDNGNIENIENIEEFVEQRSQNYSQQVAGNSREESESQKRVEKYNLIRSELREKLTHILNGLPEAGQTKEGDEYLESAHAVFINYPMPRKDMLKKNTERTHKKQRLGDVIDFKKLKRNRDERKQKKLRKLRGEPNALAGNGKKIIKI